MMKTRMSRKRLFCGLLIAMPFVTTWAFAHLCNNIYRTPDRVIVKPEKPTATVAGTEDLRVFVQNNYPTLLNNVRLIAKLNTDAVKVTVTPDSVRVMKAGERVSFTVKLTAKPSARSERYALALSISADQIGFRPVEEATTEALRKVVLNDPNGAANIQAAESLIKRNDPLGSKYLSEWATNTRLPRDYRSRAIRAIGKGGDKANARVLKKVLQQQDGFLRGNALLALGLLKEDARTFYEFFQDRDEFVRACAVAGVALAGNKDKQVLDWLKQGVKATNVYIRIACGWALAAHRYKEGVEALDQAFKTDDCMQRVMAGDALVDIVNRP